MGLANDQTDGLYGALNDSAVETVGRRLMEFADERGSQSCTARA
jgi:hypothetical protein